MFHQCQAAVQRLSKQSRGATNQAQRLLKNVVSSLAVSLQELSTNFRKGQSSYLKSMLQFALILCVQSCTCVLFISILANSALGS